MNGDDGEELEGRWGIAPFFVQQQQLLALGDAGAAAAAAAATRFNFAAPTTSRNALRVLRALQLRKPILLEGSPGVGKTSLVAAMAKAVGACVWRFPPACLLPAAAAHNVSMPLPATHAAALPLPLLQLPLCRTGAQLVRINLSEQTDMMDLLGADLPVPGGAPGEFAW